MKPLNIKLLDALDPNGARVRERIIKFEGGTLRICSYRPGTVVVVLYPSNENVHIALDADSTEPGA